MNKGKSYIDHYLLVLHSEDPFVKKLEIRKELTNGRLRDIARLAGLNPNAALLRVHRVVDRSCQSRTLEP